MSRKFFSTPRGLNRVSVTTGVMLGLALSAGAQAIPRISAPISQASLVTLKGNTLPIANAFNDLGRVPDDTPTGRVLLMLKQSPEQKAALDRLVGDQQSTSSPNFHKWLTPATYAAQFGVADADIQTVTGYLSAQGFSVRQVFPNKMAIEFSGTAGQMRSTFKTEIHNYSVNGQKFVANDRDPQIPSALLPVVNGFASLNNYQPGAKLTTRKVSAQLADIKRSKAHPMYTDTVADELNLSPGDIATIYNIPAADTGTGVTIGVVNTSNLNLTYVNNYQKTFDLTSKYPTVIIDGDDPGETANESDVIGQLEILSAVAPNATLNLYTSASSDATTGINFAIIRAVDDDKVQVLLYDQESCEGHLGTAGTAFTNALAEQAAAQGITVIAAAGNGGSDSCDSITGYGDSPSGASADAQGLSVNGYASTPFVTAVGATDFYYGPDAVYTATAAYWNLANSGTAGYTSAKGYVPEQVWNPSVGLPDNAEGASDPLYVVGTGGGISTLGDSNGDTTAAGPYPVPAWQTGVLFGTSLASATGRVVPDVSMFGGSGYNGSAYMLCIQADECVNGAPGSLVYEVGGGTNLSSATFAGVAALVVQAHGAQGNINPTLYFLFESANRASIFHAAQVGSNSVPCVTGSPNCGSGGYLVDSTGALAYTSTTTGYNAAVGLGSVNVANLITDWKSPATTPTTTTFTLTSPGTTTPTLTSFVHGTSVQGNVTVTSSSGTPTGDVSVSTNSPLSNNTGVTFYTLAGGTYTDTTNLNGLPGGTYQLKARYAGNGKFEPSTSTPFSITVTPEASQVYVEPGTFVSGSTVTYGNPISIPLAVTSLANPGSIAQPTGSVTVLDSGTQVAIVPIDDTGLATFTASLSSGYHFLTFEYPGDASYTSSSTSTNFTVGVNSQPTTTNLAASSTDVPATGSIELVAVVSSTQGLKTGAAPTGTVNFQTSTGKSLGTAKLAPATANFGSVAAVAYFQLAGSKLTGKTTVGAVFTPTAGSGYTSSLAKTITLSTTATGGTAASTTTIATTDGANSYFDYAGSVSFNVNVAGTGATPAGTVTLFANGLAIPGGSATLSSGAATITISDNSNTGLLPFTLGENAITVQYSGDATTGYAPSAGAMTINVLDEGSLPDFSVQSNVTYGTLSSTSTSAPFTLQLTSINNFSALGQAITFTDTAPAGITCSFGAKTVKFPTTSNYDTNTVTCAVATGYTVAAATPAERPLNRFWLASGGTAFACVFLLGIPARRKQWRGITGAIVLMVLTLGIATGLTACSSNMASGMGAQPETTADAKSGATAAATKTLANGTYQVLVTTSATFGTGPQTNTSSKQVHTIPLQIVVQ